MKRLSNKRLISLPCGNLESLFAVPVQKVIEYLGRRHRTTEDVKKKKWKSFGVFGTKNKNKCFGFIFSIVFISFLPQRLPKRRWVLRLTVVSIYQISGQQFSRVIGSSNLEVPTWNALGYRAFSHDFASAILVKQYNRPSQLVRFSQFRRRDVLKGSCFCLFIKYGHICW